MGLIEIASNNSVWRGMDYYNNKKVVSWKSSCNCPFADGRRVACKHMIALYFTAEPNALRKNPSISRKELAKMLMISEDGVKYHLKKLKNKGLIEHVGTSRGGYWKEK